ncbi:MAG: BrnT family toxin [Lachnospiraceae bacterium]|nr:BrnT family toxin [Lachnospiraceae bacterium]
MKFEWDSEKEIINIKKHGIDFEIASRIFNDKNRVATAKEKELYSYGYN